MDEITSEPGPDIEKILEAVRGVCTPSAYRSIESILRDKCRARTELQLKND
ncbi:hypothetical protein J4417_01735 [Candidatus Woesearchaeota archaeon]|nr:hypothetical protein [Candidatus Woesearchaeota archaeon]